MARDIQANEAVPERRRVYFQLVGVDGISPALAESGGQPQISVTGEAWTSTGISTLTAIGNGRYWAELAQDVLLTPGDVIETRYKSATTAECPGDSMRVIDYDPIGNVGAAVIVGPVLARLPAGVDLRERTRIAVVQFASVRQPFMVFDAFGEPMTGLEDRTLKFVVFDENGTGIAEVADTEIDRDTDAESNYVYVEIPTTATAEAGGFLWQLWDLTNPSKPGDLGRGSFVVDVSCLNLT